MAISLGNRVCPVCNSNEKTLLFEQSFSNFSDKNLLDSYKVVSCNKCGFCFADNIPNQEVFDAYYKEMSKYEKSDPDYTESEYDLKRFHQTVEYIKSNIENKNLYTVEIGCATGLLLSLLKKDGFTNWALIHHHRVLQLCRTDIIFHQ